MSPDEIIEGIPNATKSPFEPKQSPMDDSSSSSEDMIGGGSYNKQKVPNKSKTHGNILQQQDSFEREYSDKQQ